MPQTRIIDRGFDAVINVLPEIGGEEINRVFEKIYTTLLVGKMVSLAEIQEMFGVRKTRYSERYVLHEDCFYDWVYIFDRSISKAERQVVGVSITVSGFYKERKKSEWETSLETKGPMKSKPGTDGRFTYQQTEMLL